MNTERVVAEDAKATLRAAMPDFNLSTRLSPRSKGRVIIFTTAQLGGALALAASARARGRPVVIAVYEPNRALVADALSLLAFEHIDACPLPDLGSLHRMVSPRGSIVSALVASERLMVWDRDGRGYTCPLAALGATGALTVDDDGAFLSFGSLDFDLPAIRYASDPRYRRLQDIKKRRAFKGYGAKIKALREQHGLTQSDIPGLDPRQVRRLENGAHVPHPATIERLAAAHGMSADAYLGCIANA